MVLRAAILDYPFRALESQPVAGQMLGDVIKHKQIHFFKTSANFVVMDKHDMIGTHFLVYDVTNIYHPRLVLAIRNTYEERCKHHGVQLPIDGYIHATSMEAQQLFKKLRQKVGPLVDCNAWFVDPDYSKKNSGMNLSEFAFLMVTTFLLRMGHTHFVGATNEKYKASRWLKAVGEFPEGHTFTHPAVPDIHALHLIHPFKSEWMSKACDEYHDLIMNAQEVLGDPAAVRPLLSIISELKQFGQVAA